MAHDREKIHPNSLLMQHAHTHTHTHTCRHTYLFIYIDTHMQTHTHIYTHTTASIKVVTIKPRLMQILGEPLVSSMVVLHAAHVQHPGFPLLTF